MGRCQGRRCVGGCAAHRAHGLLALLLGGARPQGNAAPLKSNKRSLQRPAAPAPIPGRSGGVAGARAGAQARGGACPGPSPRPAILDILPGLVGAVGEETAKEARGAQKVKECCPCRPDAAEEACCMQPTMACASRPAGQMVHCPWAKGQWDHDVPHNLAHGAQVVAPPAPPSGRRLPLIAQFAPCVSVQCTQLCFPPLSELAFSAALMQPCRSQTAACRPDAKGQVVGAAVAAAALPPLVRPRQSAPPAGR